MHVTMDFQVNSQVVLHPTLESWGPFPADPVNASLYGELHDEALEIMNQPGTGWRAVVGRLLHIEDSLWLYNTFLLRLTPHFSNLFLVHPGCGLVVYAAKTIVYTTEP